MAALSNDCGMANELEELYDQLVPKDWESLARLTQIRVWEEDDYNGRLHKAPVSVESFGSLPLRVLSYNLLAPAHLEGHAQLYRGRPRYILEWEYRWRGIRREILALRPDILTLQEVQFCDPDHFTVTIKPWLEAHGYKGAGAKRTGDRPDGCAIFYRSELLVGLDTVRVEYRLPGNPLLCKDNIGLVILLQESSTGKKMVVATTHLLFSPKREDIRLAQVARLLATIEAMSRGEEGDRAKQPSSSTRSREGCEAGPAGRARGSCSERLPIVLTGDLNSCPQSPVVALLQGAQVRLGGNLELDTMGVTVQCMWPTMHYQGAQPRLGASLALGTSGIVQQCETPTSHNQGSKKEAATHEKKNKSQQEKQQEMLIHNLNFTSVHNLGPHSQEVSTHHNSWLLVDYIFYNPDSGLRLLSHLSLPSTYQAANLGSLPSFVSPSDHFPLIADFILRL